MAADCPAFVAKEGVRSLPLIGRVAVGLGSLFVDRLAGGAGHPLAIFPEGTTTNGRFLLRFRTGAFVAGLPVSPVVLSYGSPGGWSPTYESISAVAFVAGLLARPAHRVTVRQLPLYVPSAAERADARLYADNVRAVMAAAGEVGVSDSDFTDKLEYHVLTLGRSMPRNVRLRN
ncbi:hypothetical protein I4F81_011295 [Pyropia yezoensis]|uniref:Uncharacterized protein n=1 Tax=Pyropia yezoensis TaxID=2788 RepID=A0ACC3CGB9_PYRYE|nr:hypothetical protein I4F81_011295 [Neopyropia yezoensis]